MRDYLRIAPAAVVATALLAGGFGPARGDIIINGDFEAGGGSLAGWTVMNAGLFGDWHVQSGTSSPESGFDVPAPPGPTHAAMADQTGFGAHVLYQDFAVPFGITSAVLQFSLFVGNRSDSFITPATLDTFGAPNQQARVDIVSTSADPFSVAPGDVLLNLYQTQVGDPLVSGYTPEVYDLTSFLRAHAGQTLRLRFAVADNQDFFQLGVDLASLNVTAVPEPPAVTLCAIGAVGLCGYGYGRRARGDGRRAGVRGRTP